MASSEAQICNLALLNVGERQWIGSLEENTLQARASKVVYALERDAVLELHPWYWATRRATLAQLASVSRSGWEYCYGVPSDCIRAQYLYPDTTNPTRAERVPFVLESDATAGRILLTNKEEAELSYTALVEDTRLFSPLFVQALSWRLAAKLALVLPNKTQLAVALEQRFQAELLKAAAADLNQGQAHLPPDSEFITGR